MGINFNGQEYTRAYIAGHEVSKALIAGIERFTEPASDMEGTLTIGASRRRGRGATINYSVSDPNGIRAITSVIMLADDGTRADITSEISRTDANTFGGTNVRSNNKWRVASITIIYVDATSGASHTLTQSWSL